MKRRDFLKAGLGVVGAGAISSEAKANTQPNIIYIYVDQLRADSIFNSWIIKPNIDSLMSSSVNFTQAYTCSPICMGARASMMTGQYTFEHGVSGNNMAADPDGPSHVRDVKDQGYETAIYGKGHLYLESGHRDLYLDIMQRWGFEHIVETGGLQTSPDNPSMYTDNLGSKYQNLKDYIQNYRNKFWRTKEWDCQAFDARTGLSRLNHIDSYIAMEAADWIANRVDSRPFYLQVNFSGPHPPWDAPKVYRAMYDMNDPAMPLYDLVEPSLPWSQIIQDSVDNMGRPSTEQELRKTIASYSAKTTFIDELIGVILNAIEDNNLSDNTWIVLSSDHGEMLGQHTLLGKLVLFEGAVRIPLLISPPNGTSPWECSGLIDQLDITTTLMDVAGCDTSQEHGSSLLDKVLAGELDPDAQSGKDFVHSEIFNNSMIRTVDDKLVYDTATQTPEELYDLALDPEETNNVVNDSGYTDTINELLAHANTLP